MNKFLKKLKKIEFLLDDMRNVFKYITRINVWYKYYKNLNIIYNIGILKYNFRIILNYLKKHHYQRYY